MSKQLGTVVNVTGGFGWIEPDDPTQNHIFWHRTALLNGRKRLILGERVRYEIGTYKNRPVAVEVEVIAPAPVRQLEEPKIVGESGSAEKGGIA